MDALTRKDYPAMLERLKPDVAVAKLNERVKKIGKVNLEIADWLQERRKIEDAYAANLQKLAKKHQQDAGGDTSGFETPWRQITAGAENIAKSHSIFSERIKIDVEQSFRNFASTNSEMSSIVSMQGNISNMAKELMDAQEKHDRLKKRGNKINSQKFEYAANRLQAANQQWDAQAPFVFETLQALDERRLKNLQDTLAMYHTHEADQNERNSKSIESTLKLLLEYDIEAEIKNWSNAVVEGKSTARRNPNTGAGFSTLSSPASPKQDDNHGDNYSEHSQPSKGDFGEKHKLQRIGTIFTRRRQSMQSVFRSASPGPKSGFQSFGRATSSRAGRPIPSPRASSSHLRESDNRLGPVPETPLTPGTTSQNENTLDILTSTELPQRNSSMPSNSRPISERPSVADHDSPSAPALPPSKGTYVDDEGLSVPLSTEDPITYAQADQPQFKLDIRNEPILEQDSDAQAALSNVANTLRSAQVSTPIRKSGTVRGRRDARNTMFPQSEEHLTTTSDHKSSVSSIPASPVISSKRAPAFTNLSSNDHAVLAGSDNMSIQSVQSLTNQGPIKHPEPSNPGLNCSIVETVSAEFEGVVPKSITIYGELALAYNPAITENFSEIFNETIRINEYPNLEILALNKNIIDFAPESTNKFIVHSALTASKSTVAFNYRVQSPLESSPATAPLLIRSSWKHQNEKLGLILEYSLNPSYSSVPTLFSNLILIAHYSGESAASCQTKPNGTHLREKHLVYWRLGDIVLDERWCKAIARFSGANSAVPEPSHIEAKWEVNNAKKLSSNLGDGIIVQKLKNTVENEGEDQKNIDPFVDESSTTLTGTTWVEIPTIGTLVSGNYTAK